MNYDVRKFISEMGVSFWTLLNKNVYYLLKNYNKHKYIPVGCVPSAAVAVSPATHAPATHIPCHACLPCHAWPPAVHATPLWTEFLTHACENITFPQLLFQTVTNKQECPPALCHYINDIINDQIPFQSKAISRAAMPKICGYRIWILPVMVVMWIHLPCSRLVH